MDAFWVHEVEASGVVHFQTRGVVVATAGGVDEVAEILVGVRFAVAVFVAQFGDLVAPKHENFSAHDAQAERLEKPGGKAPPSQRGEFVVNAADKPNVAVNRAHDRIAVRQKINAREKQQRLPRIVVRHRERIYNVSFRACADGAACGKGLPTRCAELWRNRGAFCERKCAFCIERNSERAHLAACRENERSVFLFHDEQSARRAAAGRASLCSNAHAQFRRVRRDGECAGEHTFREPR